MDCTVWIQVNTVVRATLLVGSVLFWNHETGVLADEVGKSNPSRGSIEIPPSILQEAHRRGIAMPTIKIQGEYWIGCDGTEADASCIVLGKAVSTSLPPAPVQLTNLAANSVLEVHQYGEALKTFTLQQPNPFGQVRQDANSLTFELKPDTEARVVVQGKKDQVIDTLPRYRREGVDLVRTKDFQLVRDYIDARPNEAFNVIVTVPAMCEPCRQLDKIVQEKFGSPAGTTAAGKSKLATKLFILEYFSFADAEREVLGTGAVFPTTLQFGVEPQPRKSLARFIGNLRGSSFEEISRPLASRFRRGAPHTMSRGLLGKDLLTESKAVQLSQR